MSVSQLLSQSPLGSLGSIALQADGEWQYNKWLGRWRRQAAPAEVGGSALAGPAVSETGETVPFDDSDRALVDRVKAGDVRAFETLHRRYHARIYRFAFLRLGHADDAADVAATTFCKALNRLQSYQFRRTESIYPWLHQIASNAVVDVIRDRPAGGMLSLDAQAADDIDSFLEYLPADGPTAQELVERSEVQATVRAAINRLPADQARAVALRFLADLSIREIAVTLDRSEGAVKSLLHRALQSMRQHLTATTSTARAGARAGEDLAAVARRQDKQRETDSHVAEVINVHTRHS